MDGQYPPHTFTYSPLKTWLKSRVIVEAIKLPNLYTNTVGLYGELEAIKMGGAGLISNIYLKALPKLTLEESEIIQRSITTLMNLPTHKLAFLMPFLAIGITYLGIGVIYIYLQHTGFYRRILI